MIKLSKQTLLCVIMLLEIVCAQAELPDKQNASAIEKGLVAAVVDTVTGVDELVESPDSLIGKKVGISGRVLCMGIDSCAIASSANPTIFVKINIQAMAVGDQSRLLRDCSRLVCPELVVGEFTANGFLATASYEVHLTDAGAPDPLGPRNPFMQWQLPHPVTMAKRT